MIAVDFEVKRLRMVLLNFGFGVEWLNGDVVIVSCWLFRFCIDTILYLLLRDQ